ncbi:MAG: hypothetical protein KDE19_03575, partial [Caldilineaceae bacterium]|nr:hypothetical protein [Caldilineaceae bacterium]
YARALKMAQLYLKQVTRKEALTILTQHISRGAVDAKGAASRTAEQYVKSLQVASPVPKTLSAPLSPSTSHNREGDEDELIFADPKFWAPFVLIGDPQR